MTENEWWQTKLEKKRVNCHLCFLFFPVDRCPRFFQMITDDRGSLFTDRKMFYDRLRSYVNQP